MRVEVSFLEELLSLLNSARPYEFDFSIWAMPSTVSREFGCLVAAYLALAHRRYPSIPRVRTSKWSGQVLKILERTRKEGLMGEVGRARREWKPLFR